jgi:alginate O-acetyltransferase complex protein AlgI
VALPGLGLLALVFLGLYWTIVPVAWRRATAMGAGLLAVGWHWPGPVALVGGLTLVTYALLAALEGAARAFAPVALCLAVLFASKFAGLPAWPVVGLSYAVFRLIHVSIDTAAGRFALPGPGPFVEYALFPPAFLNGPIERCDAFLAGARPSKIDLDQAFFGVRRILFGLAKKVCLSAPLSLRAEEVFGRFPRIDAGEAWLALLEYSLFVYVDFSAYCDVALGLARLLGYRLSENFSWPYFASDIAEFWRRWHITLSQWLRDYLFLPLSTAFHRVPFLRRRPQVASSVAAIWTMLACGLWHGAGASFALWGLGHGVLLVGHQVYRHRLRRHLSGSGRRALAESRLYVAACRALTFLSVTLLWVFFRWPPARAGRYLAILFGA